jgi:hypothetical protein
MRQIIELKATDNFTLNVTFSGGEEKIYDVKPILDCEAFNALKDIAQFRKVHNKGYFIEWECEADLSADTLYIDGVTK